MSIIFQIVLKILTRFQQIINSRTLKHLQIKQNTKGLFICALVQLIQHNSLCTHTNCIEECYIGIATYIRNTILESKHLYMDFIPKFQE